VALGLAPAVFIYYDRPVAVQSISLGAELVAKVIYGALGGVPLGGGG